MRQPYRFSADAAIPEIGVELAKVERLELGKPAFPKVGDDMALYD